MFEMKPEYYIGIDMIDQEHKQLFDYASEAYELLQEEFTPDKYDKIDAILEKLRDYTVKHFTDELPDRLADQPYPSCGWTDSEGGVRPDFSGMISHMGHKM